MVKLNIKNLVLDRSRLALTIMAICSCLTACTGSYHYRAFLMEGEPPANYGPPKTYTLLMDNVIPIKKDERLTISIPEVRVGFTHRDPKYCSHLLMPDKQRGFCSYEFSVEKGIGGRDYWLLTSIIGLNQNDPLGLRQTRIFRASRVNLDQLSYGFLPLGTTEQDVFDGFSKSSYAITIKLYSVHGPDVKKTLYTFGESNLFGIAWNALYGFATATGNFLARDIMDTIRKTTKEDPSFIERTLLEASAELEFSGTAQLVLTDTDQNPERDYLLYDIIKSHYDRDYNGKLDDDILHKIKAGKMSIKANGISYTGEDALLKLPESQDEYEASFRHIFSKGSYDIESPADLREGLTKGDSLTRDQLARSYVRIHISTEADRPRLKPVNSGM